MRPSPFFLAALALIGLAGAPAAAQSGVARDPGTAESGAVGKPARAAKRTRTEPTAGQMAAAERRKKCGAEWKTAKAAGSTGGLKWPQFYSRCNTRLKGGEA